MSGKLLWTGLTIIAALTLFIKSDVVALVGGVIMIIGCVLMFLDK